MPKIVNISPKGPFASKAHAALALRAGWATSRNDPTALRKSGRQVRVHHKFQARTRCRLFSLSDCAATSRQARKSSRSRSGNSASKPSNVSPAASYSSTDSTGYRKWRMAGLPWHSSGSIVIRDKSPFMI